MQWVHCTQAHMPAAHTHSLPLSNTAAGCVHRCVHARGSRRLLPVWIQHQCQHPVSLECSVEQQLLRVVPMSSYMMKHLTPAAVSAPTVFCNVHNPSSFFPCPQQQPDAPGPGTHHRPHRRFGAVLLRQTGLLHLPHGGRTLPLGVCKWCGIQHAVVEHSAGNASHPPHSFTCCACK